METGQNVNRFMKTKLKPGNLKTNIYNPNGNWKKCKPFYENEIETGKPENRYLKVKQKPIKSKT